MSEDVPKPRITPRPYTHDLEEEPLTDPHVRIRSKLSALIISVATSGVTLAGVAYAYDKLEAKAADAGTKAAVLQVAPVVEGLKGHEARLQVLEQTSKQTQADVHEARGELRDLYKAVMDGKRSARLEAPVPPISPAAKDGGH